jgi:hypothetical protein
MIGWVHSKTVFPQCLILIGNNSKQRRAFVKEPLLNANFVVLQNFLLYQEPRLTPHSGTFDGRGDVHWLCHRAASG